MRDPVSSDRVAYLGSWAFRDVAAQARLRQPLLLGMDERALASLATERRIPSLQLDGAWMFSKKSIDKWRGQQTRRP